MKYKIIQTLFLIAVLATVTKAQVLYPDDYTRDYYELLTFRNSEKIIRPLSIHPSIIYEYGTDSTLNWDIWKGRLKTKFKKDKKNLSINILNPQIVYSFNSAYPRGYNDGPVWNGKGSNTSITGGFVGSLGILRFSFAPIVSIAENQSFTIPNNVTNYQKSEFSYPFEGNMDWVQRYGDDTYTNFHLGQSELRIVYKNVTVGLSTANLIWGPSKFNPILMSTNAGGFPHIDIGTAKPAKTKIGDLEFKMYWGKLNESDYFDQNSNNNRRYITGASFGYAPNFLKGLTIGFNRVLYTRWSKGELSVQDIFAASFGRVIGGGPTNDDLDQMLSVTFNWSFPKVGFEFYTEYARNDSPSSFTEFFRNPDRSRALTLGIMQTKDLKNGNILKLIIETTTLSENQTAFLNPHASPTYYSHGFIEGGYTQNGQIIGAGIGPGSNSSAIKIMFYQPNGRFSFMAQRIRFNDDYFIKANGPTSQGMPAPVDSEQNIGIDYVRFMNNFSLQSKFVLSARRNFYYQEELLDTYNYQFSVKLSYLIK